MPRRSTSGGTRSSWPTCRSRASASAGSAIYHVICIFEFRDDKIIRETRYYTEPFEAPEWRAHLVEPIDESELNVSG